MIRIDFTDTGARIKPLHGIGQPPTRGNDCGMFHYLTEAGIPFSRLHDVGGYFGGGRFVDIPNLFPDPDADPADPASYRFGFTDLLVTELMKSGTEPFFRLGVTVENEWAVYAARIWPPRDSLAWAKICEGVIRHYTEGWADGFHYPIRYCEIWTEPDNAPDPMENPMWRGSAEQFFELYATASTYLKEKFPHLKIGGYGSCGFYGVTGGNVPTYAATSPRFDYFRTFFDDFLAYVKAHNCPLDFFSWHSYDSVPSTGMFAAYARHRLDAEGFTETETTCDEWNCNPTLRGTRMHAALCTAMFAELPGGRFFGMAFFALLFLAALTSAISILESLVAFLTEEFHLSRARAAIGLSVPMALLSAGYSLSQSAGRGINLPWFDFKNGLQMLPMNAVMEKFTDNLMIPLGALCFCLFVGWVWGTKAAGQEIAGGHGLRRMQKPWAFAVRFLAPLVIVVILYFTLGMGEGLS